MERKYWVGLIAVILLLGMISIHANSSEWQISNNVTLIVEIGVGVVIAGVVLGISRRNEAYVEKIVKETSNIIQSWQISNEKREKDVKKFLLTAFFMIDSGLDNITKYTTSLKQSTNDSQRDEYRDKVKQQHKKNYKLAENCLNNSLIFSDTFFNLTQIENLKSFFVLCKTHHSSVQGDNKSEFTSPLIKHKSSPWIKELSEELKNDIPLADFEGNEFADQNVKKTTIPMSIFVDRTVYPLDSVVHVSFNVESIQLGEKILYKVLDSDKNLLLLQEIDPTTHDEYLELQKHGMYQTSFTMEGSGWKVKNNYTVRAIYGTWSADDSFTVDRRTPVTQCDKSVYAINSDMIITVIDPDADKNSEIVEYVGDREDSKLVIKSPYGKIDGYRLRETGESTGIFQGIVRISGVRKDGSMIPQNIDGQIIDKIQGTGILDGCIGGAPGDTLSATYTSKSGTAQLRFYISSFGAVIDLDQKEYIPTDKIHITIIAPDFSLDSEKIDEIGEKPESIVIARTSCDKIERCRLVETATDTGIFTGAVQLERKIETDSQSKNSESAGMRLFCRDDDFIEISFMTFNDKKFVTRATIQSHRRT